MYFPEEDEEFHESDYDRHNQEASDLVHESPPRDNIMQSISMARFKKIEQSSGKKSVKKKKG